VRQSSRLFGVAMAVLRDRVAAADALQEGVVRVWREAGRFDPKLDDAETWIAASVRRAAVTIARARGRRRAAGG
jgi:RNA polymerase sigma-70 factor (ECF subfamily)